MTTEDTIKALEKIRRKLRERITEEQKYQNSLIEKFGHHVPPSYEKSVGVSIGCSLGWQEVYNLIRKLKQKELK